jgi:pimeloyl-ACP methyl ester carboxylesterase
LNTIPPWPVGAIGRDGTYTRRRGRYTGATALPDEQWEPEVVMDGFLNDGLWFRVSTAGPVGAEAIILLHGFPSDRTAWDAVAPHLATAGYRVLAPDQRGYSPGARPGRRRDYRLDRLTGDVLALADHAGAGRFHVVGHDWGAVVAYDVASQYPDRVRTLTALSAPHPQAWRRSLARSTQAARSAYMAFFQVPWIPERLLAAGSGALLRRALERAGLAPEPARRYAARATERGGLTGPLHWYRAAVLGPHRVGVVRTPTVLVWGERDRFLTRDAMELSRDQMRGPFRSQVWSGVSHWIPEEQPRRLARLILDHVRSGEIGGGAAHARWSGGVPGQHGVW